MAVPVAFSAALGYNILMKFYKDRYDVIIIGGAPAGLSAAIELAEAGCSVLVLEQQNTPGGVSTSIVRNGFEMELSLHEMSGVGGIFDRQQAGKFFDRHSIGIKWYRVPESYTIAFRERRVTMHAGLQRFAAEAESCVPGSGESVLNFLQLCSAVFECVSRFSNPSLSAVSRSLHELDIMFKTAGYTTKDVMDSLDVPEEAQKLLTPYWLYVGSPLSELPFTIYAVLAGDYIGHGSFVPEKYSYEMSLKLAEKAAGLGVQVEYRQRAEKILTEGGKVIGVQTAHGQKITCDYVISGAYPVQVYQNMISPPEAVPAQAFKMLQSRSLNFTVFTLILMLEGTPQELGIENYCVFTGESTESERIFNENIAGPGPYEALIGVCLNLANPKGVPEGFTSYSITALLRPEAFSDIAAEDYEAVRQRIAGQLVDTMQDRLRIPIRGHIRELVIATPVSIAGRSGSPGGCIYGFRHTMTDHIGARLLAQGQEHFISGLEFAGAHGFAGDGMGTQIMNGETAAKNILDQKKKAEEKLRRLDLGEDREKKYEN